MQCITVISSGWSRRDYKLVKKYKRTKLYISANYNYPPADITDNVSHHNLYSKPHFLSTQRE